MTDHLSSATRRSFLRAGGIGICLVLGQTSFLRLGGRTSAAVAAEQLTDGVDVGVAPTMPVEEYHLLF